MTSAKKKGLGKGLGALFSDSTQELIEKQINDTDDSIENKVILIDINKITPNRKQPRKIFSEESLEELSESIRLHGIIQPIIVKTIDNGYEIIAGERRWRASRLAGLKEIPCLIKAYSEKDNLLVALIENLQRENLNPMDESSAYYYMQENFNLTQEEISKNVGKSRPYIANSIRLQKLTEPVKTMLIDGRISTGHGRALLAIEDPALQYELAEKTAEHQLSVRSVEEMIKNINTPGSKKDLKSTRRFDTIESDIREKIGARVKIRENNNKGSIQLSFYSREELERLIDLLMSVKS